MIDTISTDDGSLFVALLVVVTVVVFAFLGAYLGLCVFFLRRRGGEDAD